MNGEKTKKRGQHHAYQVRKKELKLPTQNALKAKSSVFFGYQPQQPSHAVRRRTKEKEKIIKKQIKNRRRKR